MTDSITVALGERSYDIHIGPGLLDDGDLLASNIRGSKVFVVSNPAIADIYLGRLTEAIDHAMKKKAATSGRAAKKKGKIHIDHHLMPEGEAHKNLATLGAITGALLEAGHTRDTTIIALGGGVVGDTAGFAAACYQRGVDFIQVPTTLLAQVDSSVGGKTAVNHPLGKNMIGAFHQPRVVLIDTDTLKTLPPRELSAGLAEVIKHGALASADYFNQVEEGMEQLLALDADKLTSAIRGSCEIKAAIVAEDEREAGKRALLNFGHTFGHAIETATDYSEWLHGEAVGAGMVMAADLSMRLGRCSQADAERIKRLVKAAGLPDAPPADLPPDEFMALMARDKKATDAGLRFVLLDGGIGSTAVVDDVPPDILQQTLEAGAGLCDE